MQCPQCGCQTPDEEWNCVSCRVNVYWASQHYRDLAGIRRRQGLRSAPETPPFLLRAHVDAMDYRADRGGKVEHKVRQIARRVMRGAEQAEIGDPVDGTGGSSADVEPGWKKSGIDSPHLADQPGRANA